MDNLIILYFVLIISRVLKQSRSSRLLLDCQRHPVVVWDTLVPSFPAAKEELRIRSMHSSVPELLLPGVQHKWEKNCLKKWNALNWFNSKQPIRYKLPFIINHNISKYIFKLVLPHKGFFFWDRQFTLLTEII